jgi:hypothetical protein
LSILDTYFCNLVAYAVEKCYKAEVMMVPFSGVDVVEKAK